MSRAPSDFFRPYGKLGIRRRLLIALLAVVTALGIVLVLLHPPGGAKRTAPPPPADVTRCKLGQTEGCVGSTTQVISSPAK